MKYVKPKLSDSFVGATLAVALKYTFNITSGQGQALPLQKVFNLMLGLSMFENRSIYEKNGTDLSSNVESPLPTWSKLIRTLEPSTDIDL